MKAIFAHGQKGGKMANRKMTNREWVDFLVEQFEVSRTTARDMLHSLMVLKTYDNYKRDYIERRQDG